MSTDSREDDTSFPLSGTTNGSINEVNEQDVVPSENAEGQNEPFSFYMPSCHCMDPSSKDPTKRIDFELKERKVDNVLEPNHPALERFQKSFKEHLLKQLDYLNHEIIDYESQTKETNSEKEEIGVETYDVQQMLCKQQELLDHFISELDTITAVKKEIEYDVNEKKKICKQESDKLIGEQIQEKHLRNEVESINLLFSQTDKWEHSVESEVIVNKRVAEKTRKDQLKLMDEKKQQDIILYRLQSEVWRLEAELETIDMKLNVKETEREELALTVAEGNTNIDALEAEHRCLMHSWNSVIIAISNRDKILNCINIEGDKYSEELKNVLSEIEQVKKLTKKEMQQNEQFTMTRQRFVHDLATCKQQIDEQTTKQHKLEKIIAKYQTIIEQVEVDIKKITGENHNLATTLKIITRDCNTLTIKKNSLEENIIKILEDETTSNKASQNFATRYRNIRSLNRKLEISLALCENKNAIMTTKLESQIYINSDLDVLLKELTLQSDTLEAEYNNYQEQLDKFDNIIHKRSRHTDLLNTKMKTLLQSMGGKEISPFLVKIKAVEKNTEELKQKIKELQQFWIREQRNILQLSQERQKQIASNDMLKKQILILQQKNCHVTDDLEAIKKLEQKTTRSILNLHHRIQVLGDALARRKGEKKSLDLSHDHAQLEYIAILKNAELECLKIESDIAEIEEENLVMSTALLDLNKELLQWEKKLAIVKETKNQISEEKSSSSDIGNMRAEVHRMEIRYRHLVHAQEKLIADLENSVDRRNSIVTSTEAREKRQKNGVDKTRMNFNRRMDDMKNKIKQIENETEKVKEKIRIVSKEKQNHEIQINKLKEELNEIKKITEDLLDQYENTKSNKQMQLELLIMKQKKLNMYSDLSKGRKPFITYKNECLLVREYDKHNEFNSKLISIAEHLLSHFPNYGYQLNRVLNTLSLPKLYTQITDRDWECADFHPQLDG